MFTGRCSPAPILNVCREGWFLTSSISRAGEEPPRVRPSAAYFHARLALAPFFCRISVAIPWRFGAQGEN